MPAGDIPPNPSELLASDRMGALIEALKQQYDLVLFDSPPALVVADGTILGSRVDGVILVTDVGQTHRKAAEQVASELRRARANLLGVVVNRVGTSGTGYGYGYGYGHYYRYDYRQSEEESHASSAARLLRGGVGCCAVEPRLHARAPVTIPVSPHRPKTECRLTIAR